MSRVPEHYDPFLTRKVQEYLYPDGEVVKTIDDGEIWVLRRNGHSPVGLGPNFKAARASINAMIRSKKAQAHKEGKV